MVFNPNLQSEATPEAVIQPVQNRGAGTAASVWGNLFSSLAPQPVAAPTEASIRRETETAAMSAYSEGLAGIEQAYRTERMSDSKRRSAIANLQTRIARDFNVDPTSGAFGAITTSITGLSVATASRTPEQMMLDTLTSTVDGQTQLGLAAAELGIADITNPAVINRAMERRQAEESLQNLNIQNELQWRIAKPQVIAAVDQRVQDLILSRDIMRENGIELTNAMVQETYTSIQNELRLINTIVPAEFRTDADFKATVDVLNGILVEMDDLVNVLGRTGEIEPLNPAQIRTADRLLAVSAAASSSNDPNILTFASRIGLLSSLNNVDAMAVDSLLADLNRNFIDTVINQPNWAREAGFLQSNNVIDIATAISVGTTERVYTDRLLEQYKESYPPVEGTTPDERGVIFNQTMEAVSAFNFDLTNVSQSERDRAIDVAGTMATTLLTLNAENTDYLSQDSLRRYSATMLNALDNIAKFNPSAAEELRTVTYAGLGAMRANIDAMIRGQSDFVVESGNRLRIPTSQEVGATGTSAQARDRLVSMVDRLYGGDLYRAYQDGFSAIEQELQTGEMETFAEGSSIFVRPTVDSMLDAAGIDSSTLDTVAGALQSLYYITAAEQRFKPKFISDRVDDFRSDATALTGQEFPASTPTFRLPDEVAQDTDFLNATARVVSNLQSAGAQISQDDLFRIIEFETNGSWSPSVRPVRADGTRISSATGLIQFLESTAQGLGTSTEALAQMTRAEQMAYVQRYLEPYAGRIRNFGDLYMAIHWPAGVGQSDDYVMYREGSREYTANRGLDANGDGTVTRGETMAVIEQRVGRGTGMMTTPRTAAGEATLEGPVEGLLPPRAAAPAAQTSVAGTAITPQASGVVQMSDMDDEPITTTQPEAMSTPAPDAPPPAQIARSLQEIAQGAATSFGQDAEIVTRVAELVTRIEGGGVVGHEELYALMSQALRLPATPEKRRLINDLYDLAERMRGQ
jgi:hypothetical protein